MHRLEHIDIINFRSCANVSLPLEDFTPIVGYNNAGKSNILAAIEWFLEASALSANDFTDPTKRLVVTSSISGVSSALLDLMPANQKASIKPYIQGELLKLRRAMLAPGAASAAKLEVRDPAVVNESDKGAWVPIPTGIPQAIKVLLPEAIRIRAMENASDDVGKASKSNTIGKLIAEIIEPIRAEHEKDLQAALDLIGSKLSADGTQRADKLNQFDAGTSAQLAELFPGLEIKLDVPLPEIPDLFKNGTVRILESQGGNLTSRTFDSVGHGAQRCIQMALIRYLAETKAAMQVGKRALLLIDEPELYLHPQGVEQVRQALKKLSSGSYQVIFTTHAPLMLHREHACHTVIVRKPDVTRGTIVRKPLALAVTEAIADAPHQSRVLFELGKAADVFFSDRVLLSEGKTEGRLLPLLFEGLYGKTARAAKIGLISIGGCSDLAPALRVLKSMEIEGKCVADLDFAFVEASKAGLIDRQSDAEVAAAKKVLAAMQPVHQFVLESNGLPKGDAKAGWSAADVWALFAKDVDGAKIVDTQCKKLLPFGVWVWTQGTIEDVIGVTNKGENMIQTLEQEIPKLTPADLKTRYPAIAELFDWLQN